MGESNDNSPPGSFRELVETISEAVYVVDRNGLVTYISPAITGIAGLRPEEVIGRAFLEFVTAGDRDRAKGDFLQILSGRAIRADYRFTGAAGQVRCLRVSSTPVTDGGTVVALRGIATDVTQAREAEEALRLTQFAVDKAADGVMWVQPNGRFYYANEAACRMLGYSPEELLDMGTYDVNPAHPKEVWAAHWQDLKRAGSMTFEAVLRRKDGKAVDVEIAAYYLEFGERAYNCAFVRDVSGRKRAERALREARGKLVSARELEQRRLAAELHDSVAQDLVALSLTLRRICDDAGAGRPVGELLTATASRCNDLIREVRAICHGLYPQPLELFGLTPSLQQLADACTQAGLKTVFLVNPDVKDRRFGAEVEIALFRIAQEAANNALRHSRADRLCLHLCRLDAEVVLAVTDNGKGFDPALATPTGLGLISMRERAEAVGGRLSIDSHPGGTTLFAHVPSPRP